MLRAIFVFLILAVGGVFALQGPFYTMLLYVWNAYFRPEAWVYGDFVRNFQLSYYIAAILMVQMLLHTQKLKFSGRWAVVCLFLFHGFLTAVFGEYPDTNLKWFQQFQQIMVIAYVMYCLVEDLKQFRILLLVVLFSLGFESVKQGWATLVLNPGGLNSNSIPFLGDNNMVAVGLLMLVPVAVAFAQLYASSTRKSWFFRFIAVGTIYRALSTYSRGGFLMFATLCATYWVRTKQKLAILVGLILIGIMILFVLPSEFWERMETIANYEESAAGRLHIWKVALAMARENPFFGVGFQGYESSYNDYDFSLGEYSESRAVHSTWFGLIGDLGYPGLMLFVFIYIQSLRGCRRVQVHAAKYPDSKEWNELRLYAVALESALWAFVVGGTFLNMHYNEMVWHFLIFAMILERLGRNQLVAMEAAPPEKPKQHPRKPALASVGG